MRVVDLSQEIRPEMRVFPVYPSPKVLPWTKRETFGFQAELLFLATHTGTHIDAPYHFTTDGKKVDELSLERLIGDAVLLDVSKLGPLGQVDSKVLADALRESGSELKEGEIAIVMTGWSKLVEDESYLKGHPWLTKDAAEFLIERRVFALGIDTPSPDHPNSTDFPVHSLLLPRGIVIIENLSNLDKVEAKRFRFVALPLKIKGATASPVRAVAIID